MDILVALLIIALVAAIAFAVVRRRPSGAGRFEGPRASPLGRRHRGVARHDPMAAAVEEHARAMDPADVVVAEQRLRAEARNVAARLRTEAPADGYPGPPPSVGGQPGAPVPVAGQPAAPVPVAGQPGAPAAMGPSVPIATDPSLDAYFDRETGERIDGFGDPANDPRYDDPRYDGRLAADWVDPRGDDRVR